MYISNVMFRMHQTWLRQKQTGDIQEIDESTAEAPKHCRRDTRR